MKNRLIHWNRLAELWSTLSIIVLLSLSLLAGCDSSSSGNPSPTTPKTTVLIYIEGTNLESGDSQATANIKEMLAASSSPQLNVVLTTGAADKAVATDPVKSWRTVKRHLIKDGAIQELQDLGNLNMGKTEVMTDFIKWGQTTYPADKYILVFWDHGGGTLWGYGGDLGTDTSGMTVMQLRQAVSDAVSVTGKRFELIGFDACLMATAEIAANLASFGRYLVVSEETEPGAGWNYTPFLNALAANPWADGLDTGTAIANGYEAKTDPETDNYTLSVIDLSLIDPVVTAINEFAGIAASQFSTSGRAAWNQLAAVRNLADEFAADYVNKTFYNLTDLGHFASLLVDAGDTYRQSALRLQAAVAQAVLYNVKGDGHANASGLSFYFPYHNFSSDQEWFSRYESVPFSPLYVAFLKPFIAYPLNNPPGAALKISDPVADTASLRATATSPFGLGEQFITIAQVGANKTYTMLGMDLASTESLGNDSFSLSYPRGNKWFSLDGHLVTVYFETREKGERYALAIPALYRPKGTAVDQNKPVNLGVRYDYATNSGIIRDAWEGIQASGVASRKNVDLNNGDIITPIFMTIDVSTIPETTTYTYGTPFLLSDEKLVFSRTPIATGTYELFFQVRDLAGTLETSNPITISMTSTAKQTAMSVLQQKSTLPKLQASVLQQGFWSGWKR